MLCVVAPFESVGGIRFGMPRAEAEEMGLEKNRMWERGKTWLRYSRDERVAAVGTVCAFSWVVDGLGRLDAPFCELAAVVRRRDPDILVRPRSLCSFDLGLTFELHGGESVRSKGYIATACARKSLWLERWRLYGVAKRLGEGESGLKELDEWTDADEWEIALETVASMAETASMPIGDADGELLRCLGLMMGMDREFFAWLDDIVERSRNGKTQP